MVSVIILRWVCGHKFKTCTCVAHVVWSGVPPRLSVVLILSPIGTSHYTTTVLLHNLAYPQCSQVHCSGVLCQVSTTYMLVGKFWNSRLFARKSLQPSQSLFVYTYIVVNCSGREPELRIVATGLVCNEENRNIWTDTSEHQVLAAQLMNALHDNRIQPADIIMPFLQGRLPSPPLEASVHRQYLLDSSSSFAMLVFGVTNR